jgi:hypothetical protein
MRTRSDSSIAGKIRKRIEKGGPDKLWTYADFRPLPLLAVAAALSRLFREGTIRRIRKGVYYSPAKTRFGELSPNAASVADAVLKAKGIEWKASGLPAYNGLGLTTQVSPVLTVDVADNIRSLGVGRTGKLRLRSVRSLKGQTAEERAILDALHDVSRIPDSSPAEVVSKIKNMLAEKRISFDRLAKHSISEPPRIRALLGAIGSEIGANPRTLARLKKSLNPMTTFHLGLREALPSGREWRIQ